MLSFFGISLFGSTPPLTPGGAGVVMFDDFNDGVLNGNLYDQSLNVSESGGYVQVSQVTDGGDSILKSCTFPGKRGITISGKFLVHANTANKYFNGRLAVYRKRDNKLIAQISWFNAKYYNDAYSTTARAVFEVTTFDANGKETSSTVMSFAQDTSYDHSLTIDFIAGTVAATINGNTQTISSSFIKQFVGADLYWTLNPFGWGTGHYVRADDIRVVHLGQDPVLESPLTHYPSIT